MKNTIKTSIIVFVGLLAMGQVAFADSAILSAQPLLSSSTAGVAFNVSVQINPAGNKVCVIKGTINFDNLSCQNITLADGLYTQGAVPTCAKPSFSIGIPTCSTTLKNLFSVSVKGNVAGQAGLSFTVNKVIGGTNGGLDVPFTSQGGIYSIVNTIQPSDKIAPVINISGSNPMFIIVGGTYTEQGGTAWDNVDGDISSNVKIEGEVNTSVIKSYQVIYSVTDKAGNKASVKRIVVVNPVGSTENQTTGLEIPSGVGELNPLIENISITTSTSSNATTSIATTTEKGNGLVATVLGGSSNIPNILIIALVLVAIVAIVGLVFYRRKDEKKV